MAKKSSKDIKRELLQKQITTLDEELEIFADALNDKVFYPTKGYGEWNAQANIIKKIVNSSREAFEIRNYLVDILESLDQTKLEMENNKEGGNDEG